MPDQLVRYNLDITGINPDNLVANEPHTLVEKRYRAIAPKQGAFYTDSVVVKDVITGQTLTVGTDFLFYELYASLTMKYMNTSNQEIAGVIVVTNPNVSNKVAITYQCVGGPYMTNNEALVNLLNVTLDDESSKFYYDIAGKPTEFVPSLHLHDLGDIYGFEYVVFALERIRNALMWSDNLTIKSLISYVNDFIESVDRLVTQKVDNELNALLIKYKDAFTADLVDLGNIVNMEPADYGEGLAIANTSFKLSDLLMNKYVTTETLVGFKEYAYSYFVSSDDTAIGKRYGVFGTPTVEFMLSMPIGARRIMDSKTNIVAAGILYDTSVYPTGLDSNTRYCIVRLSADIENKGGIYLGVDMSTGDLYVGNLYILSTSNLILSWRRMLNKNDITDIYDKYTKHLMDENNPHKVNKVQIGLGNVENLPVATRDDILCRNPVRKYITFDGLLLFFKSWLSGVKTLDDATTDEEKESVLNNYQIILTPCNPCASSGTGGGSSNGCYTSVEGITEGAITKPSFTESYIAPRGQIRATWCSGYNKMGRFTDGFGGTYEDTIEENSPDCGYNCDCGETPRGTLIAEFCEGFTKYGRYADGKGCTYVQWIEDNSSHCNYVVSPTYEVRDLNGVLIGYAYSASGERDPEATVPVMDNDGNVVCWIYPTEGLSHSVAIKDLYGAVLGYAVNP